MTCPKFVITALFVSVGVLLSAKLALAQAQSSQQFVAAPVSAAKQPLMQDSESDADHATPPLSSQVPQVSDVQSERPKADEQNSEISLAPDISDAERAQVEGITTAERGEPIEDGALPLVEPAAAVADRGNVARLGSVQSRPLETALSRVAPELAQGQLELLRLAAQATAAASVCPNIELNNPAIVGTLSNVVRATSVNLAPQEAVSRRDATLVAYGIMTGQMLNEAAADPSAFCGAAAQSAGHEGAWSFLRVSDRR